MQIDIDENSRTNKRWRNGVECHISSLELKLDEMREDYNNIKDQYNLTLDDNLYLQLLSLKKKIKDLSAQVRINYLALGRKKTP